ncbi:unnamed protein product [Trichogramma brassicae]|uniref:Uncharacterized protein n=1 Tax=Trichogramma brassicae TaxID=86971 RepID=A0A6H5ILT1_9HYME|nr:unnamed protein product [Trichogramma brassicae]
MRMNRRTRRRGTRRRRTRRLPDLRDIFQSKAIDWLLSDSMNSDIHGVGQSKLVIDFVARAGYKDEPALDEDGRPLIRRTTPIHHAANKCDTRATEVRRLFEIYNRFDVNYTDASRLTHFHVACRFALKDVVEKFLEFGQDPNCLAPETGDSPLYLALAAENKDLVELLLRNDANPDLPNKKGSTPLHLICRSRCKDSVEMFLKMCDELNQPLPIDAQNDWGDTPLHFAVEFRNLEATEWLLSHGANPNLANTPGQIGSNTIALGTVTRQRQVGRIAAEKRRSPNLANLKGSTALHFCYKHQINRSVDMLFKISEEKHRKIEVNAQDNEGNTPLHLAMYNVGSEEAIESLLRHGAPPIARALCRGANPNIPNKEGWTPLHLVCHKKDDYGSVETFFKMCDENNQQVKVDARNKQIQKSKSRPILKKIIETLNGGRAQNSRSPRPSSAILHQCTAAAAALADDAKYTLIVHVCEFVHGMLLPSPPPPPPRVCCKRRGRAAPLCSLGAYTAYRTQGGEDYDEDERERKEGAAAAAAQRQRNYFLHCALHIYERRGVRAPDEAARDCVHVIILSRGCRTTTFAEVFRELVSMVVFSTSNLSRIVVHRAVSRYACIFYEFDK